jgi:hypothetical protein
MQVLKLETMLTKHVLREQYPQCKRRSFTLNGTLPVPGMTDCTRLYLKGAMRRLRVRRGPPTTAKSVDFHAFVGDDAKSIEVVKCSRL